MAPLVRRGPEAGATGVRNVQGGGAARAAGDVDPADVGEDSAQPAARAIRQSPPRRLRHQVPAMAGVALRRRKSFAAPLTVKREMFARYGV